MIKTGDRFHRWTVIGGPIRKESRDFWEVECACGATRITRGSYLTSGRSQSCGCLRFESNLRHGMSRTTFYRKWIAIKHRCCDPKCHAWHRYGGRGIKVCERWEESFEAFLEDMGLPPSDGHSIDRINPDGDYAPENCRWATRLEQGRNKSKENHRIITVNGATKCMSEWAEISGNSPQLIFFRLKMGWSPEEAICTKPHARKQRLVTAFGETLRISEWARRYNVSKDRIRRRLELGWNPEDAIVKPPHSYRSRG